MADREYFPVPKDMSREQVAMAFAAYLLGSLAFENKERDGQWRHGPYKSEHGHDNDWQLDFSNDYWLHFEGERAWINVRNPSQKDVVDVMVKLFTARYLRPHPMAAVA